MSSKSKNDTMALRSLESVKRLTKFFENGKYIFDCAFLLKINTRHLRNYRYEIEKTASVDT